MPVTFTATKLRVDDLQAAADFYAAGLGMTLSAKYNDFEWGLEWPDGGTSVILYSPHGSTIDVTFGPSWLLLTVTNLDELMEQLTAAGARSVGEPMEMESAGRTIRIVIVTDPDGNLIELVDLPA